MDKSQGLAGTLPLTYGGLVRSLGTLIGVKLLVSLPMEWDL